MGFMDKVKAQATQLAEKAQEGAKAGQEKLGQMQSKKQADALLLELGGIVYLDRAGRGTPADEARVDELVSRLGAFEAEHGQITVTSADAQPGDSGTFVPAGGSAPDATTQSAVPTATAADGVPPAPPPPPPPASSPEAPSTIPGGGIPTGVPMSGGIPQGTTGIPTGSYSSEEAPEQQ